jgi:ubiquinone/menaquinone biosynthesis C-methylase UbiE
MNYSREYDEYWSRADRWQSHSFEDPVAIAGQVEQLCGRGSLLDVGCGMGLLVRTLAARGIDAHGVDPAARPIEEGNRQLAGRFHSGSILLLPFPDNSFDTVSSTDCLEHIAEADVPAALRELHRVARRFAFIQLATKPDRDGRWHLCVHDRTWWEAQFFNAGFRKHPLSQIAVPYEALENEHWQITLLFEKIPAEALSSYPLAALQAERDLHMDMLREPGRRSDAHIARYILACEHVPSTGLVLDAACGLGYGSAILVQSAPGVKVVGIDNGDFAIPYATKNFCPYLPNLAFRQGDVCDLSAYGDSSVDLVVSFETVEHLREPGHFLKEVRRVLKPGGRFLCSVPNLWVDETGKDPNPWHFHVFDFPKLAGLCSEHFDVRDVYRQTAGGGMKLSKAPRRLRKMNLPVTSGEDEAEWWLLAGEKELSPGPELLQRTAGRGVVLLTASQEHSIYRSWKDRCPFPVTSINPSGPDTELPSDALLLVTHETYAEPARTLIRRAVAGQIPVLILADGILEYRNTWEHPQLENGAIFQPVLGHKIATIGRSQSRWLESWGNAGKCEIVGLPRLDRHCALARRQRSPGDPFRILVNTAITPYFTETHRGQVTASLRDLKAFFEKTPVLNGVRLEPVWRLTKGLDAEIGVASQVSDLSGHEMAVALQQADAVITTSSTAILEGMFFGVPVAVLDYGNTPPYVATAWRITAREHVAAVMAELIFPPRPKMLYQETVLHDSLECGTPAAPRLLQLITGMVECGLAARAARKPLHFPEAILPVRTSAVRENRFVMEQLYPRPDAERQSPMSDPVSCPPAELNARINALLKAGNSDAARELLGRAAKSNLSDQGVLRPLAALAASRNWLGEAVEVFSKLLQIDPRDTDALLGKAVCSAERGHVVLARILFGDLLKLQPDNAVARECLALLGTGTKASAGNFLRHWKSTNALAQQEESTGTTASQKTPEHEAEYALSAV